MKQIIVLFSLILFFSGCYVSKTLDRQVRVKLIEDIPLQVEGPGDPLYLNKYTKDEYQKEILTRLKKEITENKILITNTDYEYVVKVTSATLIESSSIETVDDPESEFHGNTYELSACDANAEGILLDKNLKQIASWSAAKDKDEKVTNNRNLWQVIGGSNKDRDVYRLKQHSDAIFMDLAGSLGRRIGVRVTNKIAKEVND